MDQADQGKGAEPTSPAPVGDRAGLLLEINNAIVSHLNLGDLLRAISACLRRKIPHDLAGLALFDPETNQLRAHALDFPPNQDFVGHPSHWRGRRRAWRSAQENQSSSRNTIPTNFLPKV